MKEKIKSEIEKIDRILNNENAYTDWLKGRHSALRGVRASLERILNEEIRESGEVCDVCNGYKVINKTFPFNLILWLFVLSL